ncbi:MAG: PAS domain-containing sensor histidine kinase [Pseudomonadota bacterium]
MMADGGAARPDAAFSAQEETVATAAGRRLRLALLWLLFAGLAALIFASGGLYSPVLLWALAPAGLALTARQGGRGMALALIGAASALLLAAAAATGLPPVGAEPLIEIPWGAAHAATALFGAGLSAWLLRRQATVARQTDMELQAAKARMNALGEAVLEHDSDGRILFASAAIERLIGVSPRGLVGRSLADLAAPDQAAGVLSAVRDAAKTSGGVQSFLAAHRSGETLWVELSTQPATRPDEGTRRFVSSLRAVDEQRAREEALIRERDAAVQSNLAKSRFLANMSHELRTPLNAVIGFAEMMERETFGPLGSEKYTEYSALIGDSGRHLLELINDILDMSKIEADKQRIETQPVDISAALNAAAELMRLTAERGGVALSVQVADNAPPVLADPRALRQILLNLFSNAIKFTPDGGEILATADPFGDGVRVKVMDTGVGIAPQALARIGRPFEQAPTDISTNVRGSGLGLSLVRALARLHGGEMRIVSEPGLGTTVTVDLPAAAGAEGVADLAVHKQLERVEALSEELERRRGAA